MLNTASLVALELGDYNETDLENGLNEEKARSINPLTPPSLSFSPQWVRLLLSSIFGVFNALLWFVAILSFIGYNGAETPDGTKLYSGIVLAVVVTFLGIYGCYPQNKSTLPNLKSRDTDIIDGTETVKAANFQDETCKRPLVLPNADGDPTEFELIFVKGPYLLPNTEKVKVNWPMMRNTNAMIDPLHPGVSEAISKCQSAGFKVIMVTGDHSVAAQAIAKKLNIIKEGNKVLKFLKAPSNDNKEDDDANPDIKDVQDFDSYDAVVVSGIYLTYMLDKGGQDLEIFWNVCINKPNVVFSRVSAQQKLLIVEAVQKLGCIAAVTGDGVTNAPALKKADIGVAMGITGTEIAKEAADMILTDDNFASIVNGVEEGRIIFDNLKKSIAYTLSSNIGPFNNKLHEIPFNSKNILTPNDIASEDNKQRAIESWMDGELRRNGEGALAATAEPQHFKNAGAAGEEQSGQVMSHMLKDGACSDDVHIFGGPSHLCVTVSKSDDDDNDDNDDDVFDLFLLSTVDIDMNENVNSYIVSCMQNSGTKSSSRYTSSSNNKQSSHSNYHGRRNMGRRRRSRRRSKKGNGNGNDSDSDDDKRKKKIDLKKGDFAQRKKLKKKKTKKKNDNDSDNKDESKEEKIEEKVMDNVDSNVHNKQWLVYGKVFTTVRDEGLLEIAQLTKVSMMQAWKGLKRNETFIDCRMIGNSIDCFEIRYNREVVNPRNVEQWRKNFKCWDTVFWKVEQIREKKDAAEMGFTTELADIHSQIEKLRIKIARKLKVNPNKPCRAYIRDAKEKQKKEEEAAKKAKEKEENEKKEKKKKTILSKGDRKVKITKYSDDGGDSATPTTDTNNESLRGLYEHGSLRALVIDSNDDQIDNDKKNDDDQIDNVEKAPIGVEAHKSAVNDIDDSNDFSHLNSYNSGGWSKNNKNTYFSCSGKDPRLVSTRKDYHHASYNDIKDATPMNESQLSQYVLNLVNVPQSELLSIASKCGKFENYHNT